VLGRVVELPGPATRLPREKPLPKPRPPTKWEAYAKSKGIVKRKRSARVWDEEQGEWRGRHGYRRVGDPDSVAVMEAKSWETTGAEDPFSAAAAEKKGRVNAQAWRQAANEGRAGGAGGKGGGAGAPLGVVKAAAIARQSTASKGAPPSPSPRRARRCRRAGGTGAVQPTRLVPRHRGHPARLWLPSGTLRRAISMGVHLRVNAETSPARGRRPSGRLPRAEKQIPLPG